MNTCKLNNVSGYVLGGSSHKFLCSIRSCVAMDSNMKKAFVKQKCKEFLAFSSPEVRFLIDTATSSNKNSGQVENAEVRKLKYGNGSTETEVRK